MTVLRAIQAVGVGGEWGGGYPTAETKRKALERGAEGLFTKPIDFVTLRDEIDLLVERAA